MVKGTHYTQQPEWKERGKRGELPQQRPEVREKIRKTLLELGKRGKHHTQQPEYKAKRFKERKEKGKRGELPQQLSKWKESSSKNQKEKGKRGEHSSQRFEVKNKIRNTMLKLGKKGMLPCQQPKIKDKIKKHAHIMLGKDNPNWLGGISFEPYSIEFNNNLREKIRARDNYCCILCSKKALDVHHIDYNKKNSYTFNLIVLCRSCHIKTNWNRKYWQNLLENIQSIRSSVWGITT